MKRDHGAEKDNVLRDAREKLKADIKLAWSQVCCRIDLLIMQMRKLQFSDACIIRLRQKENVDNVICMLQEAVERGVEHARDEEFAAARQCYKQALEIFPENVDALVALGAAHANQKNFKEALSCFRKALGG